MKSSAGHRPRGFPGDHCRKQGEFTHITADNTFVFLSQEHEEGCVCINDGPPAVQCEDLVVNDIKDGKV